MDHRVYECTHELRSSVGHGPGLRVEKCTLLRVTLLHARAPTHLPFPKLQGRRYPPLRRGSVSNGRPSAAMDPRVKERTGPDERDEWNGGAKPKKKKKSNKVAPAPTAVGAGDADAAALVSAQDERLNKMRAWLDASPPAKCAKLKRLKPKTPKKDLAAEDGSAVGPELEATASAETKTAGSGSAALDGEGAPGRQRRSAASGAGEHVATGTGGGGDADTAQHGAEVVQPWWVPPCGTDHVAGADVEHGISILEDLEEGRKAAWEDYILKSILYSEFM